MADFGLAAQIGRGGGGGGMPAPVDPANRMAQLLQMQQMQQNMMLSREQEMRQQQLFPLLRQNLMTDIEAGRERTGLVREQRGQAAEMRQQAERTGTAERGALAYISSTSPELLADPARLDALRKTNPGAYNFMVGEIAKTKALQDKARAENFSAEEAKFKFDQLRLGSMSSLLPGVTEQTWPTIYNQFKSLDPIGSRVIGSDFDPRNVAALTARVQNLSDLSFEKDEQGFEFILNKRTREKTPVVKRGPNPPAASTFGTMNQNLSNPSPQLIGEGVSGYAPAGTMAQLGAPPIIQPRAAAPEAGGLSPKAEAVRQETLARETAQARVRREEGLPKAQSGYVAATEALDRQLRSIDDLLSRPDALNLTVGPLVGRSFSPTGLLPSVQGAQALIDQVKSAAGLSALIDLKQAGGTLGQVSNEEGRRVEASVAALNQLQGSEDYTKQLGVLRSDLERARTRVKEAFEREYGVTAPEVARPSPVSAKSGEVDRSNRLLSDMPFGGRR